VLVPYYLDCWQALQARRGDELAELQRAVQHCESTPVYQCSCVAGYSGDNCEVRALPSWLRQQNGEDYVVLSGTGTRFDELHNSRGTTCDDDATTTYTAARLNHVELYIDTTDMTFATVTSDSGSASGAGCTLENAGHPISEVRMCSWDSTSTSTIDLRGTPFALDLALAQQTYTGMGFQSHVTISCTDASNQICSFACTGACGECMACSRPNDTTGHCDAGETHRLPLSVIDEEEFARAFG
jgi:hypothetical protein